MTEKFKTKYHALAWAAEDENNVFVDAYGDRLKVRDGNIFYFNDHREVTKPVSVCSIIEPCHKLEVEKSNAQLATIADKQFMGHGDMVQFILDECDKRYARKK